MKLFTAILLLGLGLLFAQAAPPPPGTPVMVGAPTNGFYMTNVYFVYTNTAVRTPTIDLAQVTAYGTNIFSKATVLAWSPPTNTTGLGGYRLYYGKVGGTTNRYDVNKNVTSTAFYSTLTSTNQWWAYVTAFDTNNLESIASPQILFTPK